MAMTESSSTSPEIIVLILAAAASALYAWWRSIRENRRFRLLVKWLREHHPERWADLSWVSRNINIVGGVEQLRRNALGDDPEFMARYRDAKRGKGKTVLALLVGMGLIGAIALGVRYLGWSW
jgi:hypothetical protein